MQTDYIPDNKSIEMFREVQNRIRSMALVHDHLYSERYLHDINMKRYIMNIVHELYNLHSSHLGNIEIDFDLEDIKMDIEIASPCGMVVSELVSNSMKHAFPKMQAGSIKIGLKKDSAKKYALKIIDNGIGIPAEIDIYDSGAFGFELVTMLGEGQLGGTLSLDRSKGTKFELAWEI